MDNKKIATSERQPKIKSIDFKPIVNELQETLVKHGVYLNEFDQLMEQLKSKIISETKIQKKDNGIRIHVL